MEGRRLTFGFQGIWQGTAVLYDHQTDSLWMHLTGECFAGPLAGRRLVRIPGGRHTTWGDWRSAHPDTTVLRPDPALSRRYFPREGPQSGATFLPPEFPGTIRHRDPRLDPSDLVYGVRAGGEARAWPLRALVGPRRAQAEVGGVPVVVWFDPSCRSAAGFDRRRGGVVLSFAPAGDGRFADLDTGSEWTMDGICAAGPRKGERLTPVDGLLAEWYGWSAHHPESGIGD